MDARRFLAARGRPFGNAPWGCSARPSRTGTGVLPGFPRAGLAPSCLPRGAAKAGEWWGRRPRRDTLIPMLTPTPSVPGGALLGSPKSSGRTWPAPPAGPQRSLPAQSARQGAQALPGCASLRSCSPRASCGATPNPDPLDLMSPRGGLSEHDVKGAGQIVRKGNLPGGGDQLCPLRTPRAVSGVA